MRQIAEVLALLIRTDPDLGCITRSHLNEILFREKNDRRDVTPPNGLRFGKVARELRREGFRREIER